MHTGSYINGKWFHPKSERLVRNINPADPDEVIAEFPAATAEENTGPGTRTRALACRGHRAPAGR